MRIELSPKFQPNFIHHSFVTFHIPKEESCKADEPRLARATSPRDRASDGCNKSLGIAEISRILSFRWQLPYLTWSYRGVEPPVCLRLARGRSLTKIWVKWCLESLDLEEREGKNVHLANRRASPPALAAESRRPRRARALPEVGYGCVATPLSRFRQRER